MFMNIIFIFDSYMSLCFDVGFLGGFNLKWVLLCLYMINMLNWNLWLLPLNLIDHCIKNYKQFILFCFVFIIIIKLYCFRYINKHRNEKNAVATFSLPDEAVHFNLNTSSHDQVCAFLKLQKQYSDSSREKKRFRCHFQPISLNTLFKNVGGFNFNCVM